MSQYINHSGGCPGSDMMWENEGLKYNVETMAYSFHGHVQKSYNPIILSDKELEEGWENVLIAGKTLKRNLGNIKYQPYVKNLLSRNYFQIKNSSAVFAVGTFVNESIINGGTGWAVQMAIDNNRDVFFFSQEDNSWYEYNYRTAHSFIPIKGNITIPNNFAGIGTRGLTISGKNAIKELMAFNFKTIEK